ncbi:MAG: ribosome-associated translation inhibitor RaiA [Dehalococcoidia bacterium]|nr:ribosome-associated translation inhibitor RaiA [Dehalococcoidia bacterium]
MEIQLVSKNVELSQTARERVQRKIGKLSRHLSNITDAKVEIYREGTKSPQQRYVAQVTIVSDGTILRGEERAADVYTALNSVIEVIDRQIERYKGRLYYKGRGKAPRKAEAESSYQDEMRIVKVKELVLSPMSADDALVQMELLGHDFFIFLDSATKNTSVIYRRRNGDYGLLEAQLD